MVVVVAAAVLVSCSSSFAGVTGMSGPLAVTEPTRTTINASTAITTTIRTATTRLAVCAEERAAWTRQLTSCSRLCDLMWHLTAH